MTPRAAVVLFLLGAGGGAGGPEAVPDRATVGRSETFLLACTNSYPEEHRPILIRDVSPQDVDRVVGRLLATCARRLHSAEADARAAGQANLRELLTKARAIRTDEVRPIVARCLAALAVLRPGLLLSELPGDLAHEGGIFVPGDSSYLHPDCQTLQRRVTWTEVDGGERAVAETGPVELDLMTTD